MTVTVIEVLVGPAAPFADAKRDAVIVGVGSLKMPIDSIAHLIVMETGAAPGKYAIDIDELRKIQTGISSC